MFEPGPIHGIIHRGGETALGTPWVFEVPGREDEIWIRVGADLGPTHSIYEKGTFE